MVEQGFLKVLTALSTLASLMLFTNLPTTLEEALSATPPPNPPATSKIISSG
jgi:hypothetical protein